MKTPSASTAVCGDRTRGGREGGEVMGSLPPSASKCRLLLVRQQTHGFDQLGPTIGFAEKKSAFGQIFPTHPRLAGGHHELDRRPTMTDGVGEPETVHAPGHVDIREDDPDVSSSFQQGDGFVRIRSLQRCKPCSFEKGHGMKTDQELIFNNQNQWLGHGAHEKRG